VAGAVALLVAIAAVVVYRRARWSWAASRKPTTPLTALSRELTVTAALGVLLLAAQSSLITWVVSYLTHDRGLLITTAGLYLALTQFVGAGGRVMWGVMSDRLMGGRRLMTIQWAACVGALGAISLAIIPTDYPMVVVAGAIVVCAVGAIGWNGIQTSLLSEIAPTGREATSVGLGLTLMQPGQVGGPFVFGALVDATGSFRPAWAMLAAALTIAAVATVIARTVFDPERSKTRSEETLARSRA
jgi:MFS family permease